MIISLIAAMDENQGIGWDNHLPWRLSTDYRLFKSITVGHHIIMGRKTYESLGNPLPQRTHIIISSNRSYPLPEGCILTASLDEAFALAESRKEGEVFVIGGAMIYTQALSKANWLYLTRVHAVCQVDAYFPAVLWQEWEMCRADFHKADEKNEYAFTFQVWRRKME